MGVLAQDVEKVAPEVISIDDNGKMGGLSFIINWSIN